MPKWARFQIGEKSAGVVHYISQVTGLSVQEVYERLVITQMGSFTLDQLCELVTNCKLPVDSPGGPVHIGPDDTPF